MTERPFKKRVEDEARHFAQIYSDFKKDLEVKAWKGLVENNWLHLFSVPFDGSISYDGASEQAKRALNVAHRHDPVLETIKLLGLDELRAGAIKIEDWRITPALEAGLLTAEDLVEQGDLQRLATRYKTDHSDPIFWRTLLEIFCRAFVGSQGQRPWTIAKYIDLAFDLDEITRKKMGGRWDKKTALEELRKEPYDQRYEAKGRLSGVGPDRIDRLIDLIGRPGDGALKRLKELFPEEFFEVDEMRAHRERLAKAGPMEVLGMAENLSEALEGSSAKSTPEK